MMDNGLSFDKAGVLALALLLSPFASPWALGQDTGRIAFLRQAVGANNSCEFVLMDLSPRQEVLTLPACSDNANGVLLPAAWSHAGAVRWLVLRRVAAPAVYDGVWAMLEDGTSMHQVFPDITAVLDKPHHPTLSRDDQWLAFSATAIGSTTYAVFIQSFDPVTATVTGAPINLTQGTVAVSGHAVVFGPSLPSNGQSSLAFTATGAGGLTDVYRMDLSFGAGGPTVAAGPVNLTNTAKTTEGGVSYGLDWSVATASWPSGRLAFPRSTGTKVDLVHMDPSPGVVPVVINRDKSMNKVSWSPTADRILYALNNAASDLAVVSPNGSGKVKLTNTSTLYEGYATWRP